MPRPPTCSRPHSRRPLAARGAVVVRPGQPAQPERSPEADHRLCPAVRRLPLRLGRHLPHAGLALRTAGPRRLRLLGLCLVGPEDELRLRDPQRPAHRGADGGRRKAPYSAWPSSLPATSSSSDPRVPNRVPPRSSTPPSTWATAGFIESSNFFDGVTLANLKWPGWYYASAFAWGRQVLSPAQLGTVAGT